MPLWTLYSTEGTYSAEDKREFATSITGLYTQFGIPAFYVSVIFHDIPRGAFLVGGRPAGEFVRIAIDQIARRVAEDYKVEFMNKVNETIAPFVDDRGYDSEVHIDETPNDLWTINGLFPPPADSDEEKRWAKENKALAAG